MSCSSRAATRRSEGARPVLPRSARRRRRGKPVVPGGRRRARRPHRVRRGRRRGREAARSTATGWCSRPASSTCTPTPTSSCSRIPTHACKVHQGVTLEVLGQDGLALAPTTTRRWRCCARSSPAGTARARARLTAGAAWRTIWHASTATTAVNVCDLVPHATLRLADHGRRTTVPPRRTSSMRCARSCARAVAEGAVGPLRRPHLRAGHVRDRRRAGRAVPGAARRRLLLPTPPQLRPARAQGLRRLDRDRAPRRRAAAPRARASRLRLQSRARGRAARADRRRRATDGVDVTLDTYPYLAGATYLHALLPGWVHAGGPEAIIARLRDPDLRERLRVELEETGSDGFHDVPVEWDTRARSTA